MLLWAGFSARAQLLPRLAALAPCRFVTRMTGCLRRSESAAGRPGPGFRPGRAELEGGPARRAWRALAESERRHRAMPTRRRGSELRSDGVRSEATDSELAPKRRRDGVAPKRRARVRRDPDGRAPLCPLLDRRSSLAGARASAGARSWRATDARGAGPRARPVLAHDRTRTAGTRGRPVSSGGFASPASVYAVPAFINVASVMLISAKHIISINDH